MRFKRGSKVEVMNKEEELISWRCAKIISGNGRTYSVKYGRCSGSTGEAIVERVSRRDVRPCPPHVEGVKNWLFGDVVEVSDNGSWKVATVLKVLDRDHYVVRLFGLLKQFRVHKSKIRVQQAWQDNKWVVIGKGYQSCEVAKSENEEANMRMLQESKMMMVQVGHECFGLQENAGPQDSHMVSSTMRKRASPYSSALLDARTGKVQKMRAIRKEGGHQRFVPAPLQEKVDAVACPRESMGEKYMHSSFNNRSDGYYEMERAKLSGLVGCSLARSSEPNDSDSNECSVGSCSVTSESLNKFPSHYAAGDHQVTDALCSDAGYLCGSGNLDNCPFPPEEEVAASIHRLELHAYRCTLGAFYASGPLSWEQEALLTNLRIMLHISNDEHLMELRNLISSGTGFNNR